MVKHVLLSATILSKTNYKFLEEITVNPVAEEKPADLVRVAIPAAKKDLLLAAKTTSESSIEGAGGLQFKYSLLMDVEVELLKNLPLLRIIDEWYGTRYIYGGSTKRGIDCSALMQVFFASLYGMALPRTAKMQYDFSRRISRTELKEGDLLFFNTTGGVSHVGMYLCNNKFVHASSSNGVTISDMFDPYYAARIIGVGRVLEEADGPAMTVEPNP
jgi:hypothetical protein